MAERTGGWLCATPLPASGVASAAAGHCKPRENWCWYLVPGAGRSTWAGQFKYGFGRKPLGTVKLYYEVALSGRKSESKPVRFTSTGAVRNVVMFGDRLFYDSNWPAGHPISPRVDESHLHHPAYVPAGAAVLWPGGYVAIEQAPVHYGAVVHTWKWQVSGYTSTWFVFAKSRPGHGTLYVNPAAHLPDSEWHASWEDDYPTSEIEARGGATIGTDGISGSEEVVLRWARTSPARMHLILQHGKWVRMPLDQNWQPEPRPKA